MRRLLLLLVCVPLQAQLLPQFGSERVGIALATALKLAQGARSAGLNAVAVALPQGGAVWLNPALVAELPEYSAEFSTLRFVADIAVHTAYGGVRLGELGSAALSAAVLALPPIPETTEFQPYGTGRQWHFGHWNIGLSYARRLTEQFSAGVTLRYIREQWAEARLEGIAWDAGTLYWTGFGTLRFAVVVSAYGAPLQAQGQLQQPVVLPGTPQGFRSFAPPTVFRIGVGGELFNSPVQRLSLLGQLDHPSDNAESYALAAEYAVRFSEAFPAMLSLRCGIRFNAPERWSVGAGVAVPFPVQVELDYALAWHSPLGAVHRIGLQVLPPAVP
jgi:hypothetical protein